jgi:hypothetical protein
MLDAFRNLAGDLGALFAALASGAAFVASVSAPNISYDRLDASRADGHVRALLLSVSAMMAALLLAATALGVLAGHFAAASTAALAAFGFFSNRWTLAPRKAEESPPPGVRQRRKTQRVVAVGLSLMFLLVAAVSAVLGVLGV